MKRRAVLAAVGALPVAVSGCLSGDTPENDSSSGAGDEPSSRREYDTCEAVAVEYDELPDPITAEVDAAFDDGSYETSESLLYEEAVDNGMPLWREGTPYHHRVDRDGETAELSFTEWSAYASSETLELHNEGGDTVSASVTVTNEATETILETGGISLSPGDVHTEPVTSEFGRYEVDIAAENGTEASDVWVIEPDPSGARETLEVTITGQAVDFELVEEPPENDAPSCAEQWNGSA
ncbi:hypothetical protein [Natronobiforma cellulositropha]|uniref:hypothetical protein n=1 Tax=Natronobiforma cellulositropha TaxID=1679076 RepID=UPI0021D5AC4A|nr:hypothetical protein [Natronobiforma cellulositropha]